MRRARDLGNLGALMEPLTRTLAELVRRLGPSIAQEPLATIASDIGKTPGTFALLGLATITGRSALGEVFEHPLAQQRFRLRLPPFEQRAMLDDLATWSGKRAELERQRKVQAAKDALVAAEHELDAWADGLGVRERLRDSISVIAPFIAGHRWHADQLAHFATGDVRRAALGRTNVTGIETPLVVAAARRYVEACAAERARDERRAHTWAVGPASAVLAHAAERLAVVDQTFSRQHRAALIDASRVAFDPLRPAFAVDDPRTGTPIIIVIEPDTGAVTLEGAAYHSPALALALTRIVRDAVHDPEHPLHAELEAALAMPPWRRLVQSVDAIVTAPARVPSSRVVFRVHASADGAPHIELALQRRGAKGQWSKGSRAAPVDVLRSPDVGPAETAAAYILFGDPTGGAATALYVLAGSDRVILTDGAPLSVRRVEARFALAAHDDGARPALQLGDALVPADRAIARLHSASCVAHVLLEKREVLVAPIEPSLTAILRAASPHGAPIPATEWGELMPMIERIAARAPITLPPALEATVVALEPALFVRIVPAEEGAELELRVRTGPSLSVGAGEGSRLVSVLDEGTGMPALRRRDLDRERDLAGQLALALGLPDGSARAQLASDDALLAVLEVLRGRPEVEVEWPSSERTRFVGQMKRSALRISLRKAADWFGVDGEVEIDGETIALADLLAQIRQGRRYVRVGPGRFATIEADLRARLERAADVVFASGQEGLAVAPASGDAVEALAEEGALDVDAAWTTIRARLAKGALASPRVPAALKAELRDYQRAGFTWLARLASVEAGAVLADDMGLGKTVQALALLAHRAKQGPALVVAPTSLSDNWAREAERFAPSLRVRLHRGPGREEALAQSPLRAGDVLIASYDIAAMDIESLSQIELATLVLDEAQWVKNPDAQRTKAVRRLRARARVALTGTPLENRLSELWSIFSIVHPGLLGPWDHFRARFALPIERDHDPSRLAALSALIRPYLLRRTKEVVTPELPARMELTRDIALGDAERRLYDAERADALAKLASADESQRFAVLASITRLRQLACDASLVVPGAGVASSKLAVLVELLEELAASGRKVLVFSQFVRLLDRAAILLDERKISHLRLDGSTPAIERARLVSRFQAGEATAFLLSLKAGGIGLNLTAADHVVHLDPWWNPAVEDQASDRAHRIGQDKPVTIVRLVAQGTIEESVLALHESKRALVRGVLEGADAAGSLSASELVSLIRGDAPSPVRKKTRAASR